MKINPITSDALNKPVLNARIAASSLKNFFMVIASCLKSSFQSLETVQSIAGVIFFRNAQSLLIQFVFVIVQCPFDCVYERKIRFESGGTVSAL